MGKTHRKSVIKQAIERFDSLMAIGESRFEAKQAARREAEERGEHIWTFTTGRIHSHKTRTTYQEHTLRFVNWARQTEGIKTLEELASRWLLLEIAAEKSPYTLQMERSALRMFFSDRVLASAVSLPKRAIVDIKRSRGPVARDHHFQPANWTVLLDFQRSVGLRRDELAHLKVEDIQRTWRGDLVVHVRSGKGGKERILGDVRFWGRRSLVERFQSTAHSVVSTSSCIIPEDFFSKKRGRTIVFGIHLNRYERKWGEALMGKPHRKSIIKEVLDRLDSKMAIGESRLVRE